MTHNKLQLTPAVYRCIKSLLTAICTFGVEAYAPIRRLPELELHFAQEALNYLTLREQAGAYATNPDQDAQSSVAAFKGAYTEHLALSGAKEAFCSAMVGPGSLRFGGREGWPVSFTQTPPTVETALAVAEATMAEYQSLYETLMFLAALGPGQSQAPELNAVASDLNYHHGLARVRWLQFSILTGTPETLPELKASLKDDFAERYSVMQHLNFGGTVPSGWPSDLEEKFRASLLQS